MRHPLATRRAILVAVLVSFVSGLAPAPSVPVARALTGSSEFNVSVADLQFILQQIRIAEAHATREGPSFGTVTPPTSVLGVGTNDVPDPTFPWGLRAVDGSGNNLAPGRNRYGAVDGLFPRLTNPQWRDGVATMVMNGHAISSGDATTYSPLAGSIVDLEPRVISNLIANQSIDNPAAVAAAGTTVPDPSSGGFGRPSLVIENTAPAGGVAPVVAPYNAMFTFFGQFFDHGLDLIGKSSTSFVALPLPAGDDLATDRTGPMLLSRTAYPAGSNITLTAGRNLTTPWVDQNQTYASIASKQVFLREYEVVGGQVRATGRLLTGPNGEIADWTKVKQQARDVLGIALTDADVTRIPLVLTDEYGRFLRGRFGLPQLVLSTAPLTVRDASTGAPVSTAGVVGTGHAFLDDIAHNASPNSPLGTALVADADSTIGSTTASLAPGTYDDELLGVHYITGDGRGNENIGLTAIHTVFHAEHNRLRDDIHATIQANLATLGGFTLATGWGYGERLFQAARFVNENEYQHLVFDTFVRRIEPTIHPFFGYDQNVQPDITAEFANAVYRFGHSMLNETIRRRDANGNDRTISLFEGFLNPASFMAGYQSAGSAAASVARGSAWQIGNEIDEFVTGALRNNLVGVPLDLASLNLARGRDTGMPSLNNVRMQLWQQTGSGSLIPYDSWGDLRRRLRHPESLVNFIAAYGTHATILEPSNTTGDRWVAAYKLAVGAAPGPDRFDPADDLPLDLAGTDLAYADRSHFLAGELYEVVDASGNTVKFDWRRQYDEWGIPLMGPDGQLVPAPSGIDAVDLWIGGLAETRGSPASLLGSTFTFVFKTQMEKLQDGDRFYYLHRLAGTNLLTQVANNTLADMFVRNTDAESLPADLFSAPQIVIDLSSGSSIQAAGARTLADGTVRYDGSLNAVFVGTSALNKMRSGAGNDTMRGFAGNDTVDGDEGNDNLQGGAGNDVLVDTGFTGIDLALAGSGDDYVNSGPGADVNEGGLGNDFFKLDADGPTVNGGSGRDLVQGGWGADLVSGDGDEDWIEGGPGNDLLQGDAALPALGFDLIPPGPDVVVGGMGPDTLAGGGLDDVFGGGDTSTLASTADVVDGGTGFDWITYTTAWYGSSKPGVIADLGLMARVPGDPTQIGMDLFISGDVEAASGSIGNDTIYGDIRTTFANPFGPSDALDAAATARIGGTVLARMLTRVGNDAGIAVGLDGNILVGGGGSDVISGRLGNDLIDGDASLSVWLEHSCVTASNPTGAWVRTTLGDLRTLVETRTTVADPAQACTATKTRIRRELLAGSAAGSIDTAAYAGSRADYTIRRSSAPVGGLYYYVVEGIEGTDVLWNVERLQFLDQTISIANAPATLNAVALSSKPTLVTAVPGPGQVTVKWALPLSPGGGSMGSGTTPAYEARAYDATLLLIGRCTAAGDVPANRACTIGRLTDGFQYSVDVVAINSQGTSNASNPVLVTPGTTPTVPAAVASANVRAVASNSQANVTWNNGNDGGSPVIDYTVQVWTEATSPAGALPAFTCVSAITSCTVVGPLSPYGLAPYGRYYVDVVARNAVGVGAPSSPRVIITSTPTAPQNVRVAAASSRASVTWDAPTSDGYSAVTGYSVTAFTAEFGGSPVGTGCTLGIVYTCTITGLTNGTTYWVSVAARNVNGTGIGSDRLAVTPAPNPPSEPQSVTATAGNTTAAIGWTAPASSGAGAITGYTARAWTAAAGGASPAATCAGSLSTLGCTITGLLNDVTYYVDVVAANADGTGPASAPRVAVTPRPNAPGAPTISSVARGDGSATPTWVPPTNDGGAAITRYVATAYSAASGGSAVGTGCETDGAGRSCAITGLVNGTTYWVSVVARNSLGDGPSSARTSVTPAALPSAPASVDASAGNALATITWTAASANGSAITGYTVRAWAAASGGTTPVRTCAWTTGALTCQLTTLTNGTTYYVDVVATNAVGSGPASTPRVSVTPQAVAPGAPTGVALTRGDRAIGVSWVAPTSNGGATISGYTATAYDASTGGTGIATCSTASATTVSCSITGLVNGTTYWVSVVATNVRGDGPPSSPRVAMVPNVLPGAPTGVSASTGGAARQIAVSWKAPTSGGTVVGYVARAYTRTTGGSPTGQCTWTTGTLSCTITGLRSGTTYYVDVAATNQVGTGPASAPRVTFRTL
ncbi:MAG: hypothetical protein RL338_961 [Chloroflexota bacterium]